MNSKATTLKRHPLSVLFSMHDLEGEELDNLVKSIAANGQRVPITTYENMVLDGWNRYTACAKAGVEPITSEFEGSDPWGYVWDLNANRGRSLTPLERVAVMLRRSQMEGVQNCTPHSVSEIERDLNVSHGTAQKAAQIAKSNDPAITEALADKRVSLDDAARIAKLPKEERKAAIEAPQPKPEPKAKVSDDTEALKARITELEAENTDLQERCNEAASLMQALQEENEAMQRTLDAEDLRGAFQKEVKRAHERARIAESRCTGLTVEVNELKGFCKMWKGKFERLEKANKKAEGAAA